MKDISSVVKKIAKVVSIIIATLLVLILATCGGLYFFLKQDGLEIERRIPSPNLDLDAIIFTRDYGATTTTVYCLTVVPKGTSDLNNPFFVSDQVDNPEDFDLKWNDETLNVKLPKNIRIFEQKENVDVNWKTIQIKYSR